MDFSSPSSLLSPTSSSLKQCRSSDHMVDFEDRLKLARTDSFPRHQPDLKMHINSAHTGTLGSLVRSNSVVSCDGRTSSLGCSPTHSCSAANSDPGQLLASEPSFMSDSRLLGSDPLISYPTSAAAARPLSYHHQAFPFRPSGLPLGMSREMASQMGIHDNEQSVFTINQLRELQHHALVFKYLVSGVNVPMELVRPIRNSVAAAMAGMSPGSHHLASLGWGNYHLGYANNTDPEPGRCRRTDGKKWRCSRDVVPDQKYCERHMHRGRHRSRKPAENQSTTSSSPPSSVVTSTNSSAAARSATTPANNNLRPSMTLNVPQQQQRSTAHAPGLGIKSFSATSSPNSHGGSLSIGSSIHGSQFQLPVQQSSSATTDVSAKDFRYLNGDLGQEQVFFSEASGNIRGQESQPMCGLSVLSSSVNNPLRSMQQSKVSPALQSNAASSTVALNCSQYQLRSMFGQDFVPVSNANTVNLQLLQQPQHQHQQQHHSFLSGGGYAAGESVNVGRESEGQPLRHFFDDWPRTRDPSTLSWSDVDEDRSNRSSSTTQLSISIPMASSDFTSANGSSPRGKLALSPLKLSMSRAGEDDSLGMDATQMGLGVGMMNDSERHDRQQQTNWIPITWEPSVGGPLAEVLQSSTPRGCKNSSALNLMSDGWENSPRESPRMASPTGVLQNATFGAFSDTSTGSSPRAITKIEPSLCDHLRNSDNSITGSIEPGSC